MKRLPIYSRNALALLIFCTFLQSYTHTTITPPAASASLITAEISLGELIDKITILMIKQERITDESKLHNIRTELESLVITQRMFIAPSNRLRELTAQLLETNKQLWDIEDQIREKEMRQCFDQDFIQLARGVYHTNDERCRIKREINMLLGSRLVEEKSYKRYK